MIVYHGATMEIKKPDIAAVKFKESYEVSG